MLYSSDSEVRNKNTSKLGYYIYTDTLIVTLSIGNKITKLETY